MGQPQHEYLTVAESESLHNKALRQQAKTIETFLSIAALTGTADSDIQRGIDRIRALDKPTARRYGKQLLQTLQVFGDLLPLTVTENKEVMPTPELLAAVEQAVVPLVVENDLSDESSMDSHDDGEDSEPSTRLSMQGKKLAKTLLGKDFRVEDHTVEQIAQMIYEKAGSPVSNKYTESGKVPVDAMARLVARLEGTSYQNIAQHEGDTTAASIQIWLSTKFIKPIRGKDTGAWRVVEEVEEPDVVELGKKVDSEISVLTTETIQTEDEDAATIEGLINANFSREEAIALMECFEFDGGSPKKRREEASAALNNLQQLLAKQAKNIDNHPALPGLRMLSNPIFGQKTVFDVYLSMHKRDNHITQDDVTEILRDGTTILVNGKEDDSRTATFTA